MVFAERIAQYFIYGTCYQLLILLDLSIANEYHGSLAPLIILIYMMISITIYSAGEELCDHI